MDCEDRARRGGEEGSMKVGASGECVRSLPHAMNTSSTTRQERLIVGRRSRPYSRSSPSPILEYYIHMETSTVTAYTFHQSSSETSNS